MPPEPMTPSIRYWPNCCMTPPTCPADGPGRHRVVLGVERVTKDVTPVTGRRERSGQHNGPVDDRDRTGRERPRRGADRHGAVESVAAAVAGALDEAVDHLVDDATGVRAHRGQSDEPP